MSLPDAADRSTAPAAGGGTGGQAPTSPAPVKTAEPGSDPRVEEAVGALADPEVRLLTLLGPGGVGKTRRARAVTAALTAAGAQVRTVELAEAASAQAGLAQCAGAFEAGSGSDAERYVVIENLEALLGVAGALGELLDAHPRVTVLATSRAACGLSAEHLHRVAPLPVSGDLDAAGPDAPAEAVELFLRFARRVACEPDLDARRPTVAAICRRLDGLPLALIIAAGQLTAMTSGALLERLEEGWSPAMRGPVDLPERQATLARAVEADVNGLSPGGLALFRLLVAFEGRIDYPAVSGILAPEAGGPRPGTGPLGVPDLHGVPGPHGPDGLWQQVSELVAHSLLVPVLPSDNRPVVAFRMLSTIRDSARLLFRDDPDSARLREAHARYHAGWVLAGREAYGVEAEAWLRRLDAELGDVRAALRFFADAGDERVLDLAAGLRDYWLARGLLQEGLEWLDEALGLPSADEGPAWVRALEARAVLTGATSGYAHVLADLERCAERWQQLDRPAARARTLVDLGAALFEVHGFDRAEPVYEEAIEALEASGDRWWAARARSVYGASAATVEDRRELAMKTLDRAVEGFRDLGEIGYTNVPLQQLGRMLHESGHDVQATALLNEGLGLAQQTGDAWNTSVFLNLLAEVERGRGDSARSGAHYVESLRLAGEIGARPRFIWCLEGLAACLDDLGEAQHAARLVGLTHAVRSSLNLHDWTEFPARAIDLSGIRAGFPPAAFTQLCAEGSRMTVGDVLEMAPPLLTAKRAPVARKGRRSRFPDGLTSREAEVLRLIASGATSRAIASELFISVETVGRHISNLYRKIGASGRAEATLYAMRSGLLTG